MWKSASASGSAWSRSSAASALIVSSCPATGHGASTVPVGGGYFCELLMADVDAALAHLGPATVYGRGLGAYVALLIAGSIVGLVALLVIRRDVGVAYVAIAGLVCGVISAIISAPIAAGVFGGVTGSGTDFLVAAFQRAGSDLTTAVLQQGLLSDPIDKTVTFFVVFVLLQTLSRRFIARFPQGEKAVGLEDA